MQWETIQALNAINREFYQTVADEFHETRGKPWPGWVILYPYLVHQARDKTLAALDVGCGNGRFAAFLHGNLESPLLYHGMDNNAALLDHAAQDLGALPRLTVTLEQRDVVMTPPDHGEYDLVVLFGLIHHIPGNDYRREFMRKMAERVKPGGLLIFACWRFYEYERFRQRILPWPEDLAEMVEPQDYLLDWRRGETETGAPAQRYCHYVDDAEHQALVAATQLQEIHSFRADGFTNTVNRYSVLQRR